MGLVYEGTPKRCVDVSGMRIGAKRIVVAAGPCSVESEDQLETTAKAVKRAGATMLRGGAFKPRSSPYSFQGLGIEGLGILERVGKRHNMPVVTEIMEGSQMPAYSNIDMIQVGARNSQNFELLKALGRHRTPVLLKNGLASTVDEWLMSAEYILSGGNCDVVMCYRGTRSFDRFTRFAIDPGMVAALNAVTWMPVAVDPSHAAGRRSLVGPIALAAVAAGADMLEIEVHPDPDSALSDKDQQLSLGEFEDLMKRIKKVAASLGRSI